MLKKGLPLSIAVILVATVLIAVPLIKANSGLAEPVEGFLCDNGRAFTSYAIFESYPLSANPLYQLRGYKAFSEEVISYLAQYEKSPPSVLPAYLLKSN